MALALGVDVGTTAIKCTLCSPSGQLLASSSHAHHADVPSLPEGRFEQVRR
jgi:sugar (pentulose or hexulose) kinase